MRPEASDCLAAGPGGALLSRYSYVRKSGSSGNEEGESGSVKEGVSSRERRFRTWTTCYSSIRDTGTRVMFINTLSQLCRDPAVGVRNAEEA